ncbi:hypothetical protein SARC_05033 [Sphaeroforma arctica JP610]|uniref:Zinc finger PHD-type domain-containing protein n=1 Tax=Sphaeroforma arctica JP610 TaxID=667725 RepID=A0A0L0G1I7_9EUKA|nr:hypothetical protein SARC_05033 [Sphaeroforma arctica JP610]KNC82694.1 hypothetical protein SARC_05033 [Sphaeroforma arctica JP610]|eukprot:XP_014156596.1 hypothetical protein SARC_05033 [Sphaeroforma arctica JP610]
MTDKKSLESNKAQDKSRAKQISAEARYIGSNPFELAKGSTSKRKSNVTLKLSHAFGDLESSKRMRVPDDNKLGYAAVATNELSANERNSHAKEDMGVAEEVEKDIQEVDISSRVVNESRGKTKGLDTQDKPSTGTKSKEPGTAFFQLNGAETVPEYDPQLETRVSRSGKTIKTGTVGAFSPVIKTGRKASKQDGSGIIRGDISGDSAINRTEADTRTHGSETGDTSGVDEGEGMSANTSPPVNSAETLLTTHNHAPMNAGKYAAVVKAKTTPRGKRGRPLARGRARARGWVGVVPQHSLPIAGCTGIAKDGNVGETEEVSGIEDRCMSVGEGENEGDDDTAEKELETRLNSGKEVVGECGDTGTKRDGEVAESVGDGAEAETDGEKGQLQKVPGEEKNGGDGMVDSVKGPEAATVAMDTDSADVSTAFEVRDSTEKENMEGCAAGSKDNSGINNNATEEEDTEGCDAGSKDKQVNHNSGINNNATEEADTEISDAGSKDKQVNDNSGINNNATEKADTEVSDADSEDKQVNDNSEINNNAAEKADTEGCDAGSEAKQVNDNSGINNNAAINDSEEGMGAVEYDHKASDVGNGRDVTISTGVLTPQPQTADKTDSTTAESCGRVKSNPDTDTDTDTTCAEKTNSTEQLGDKTGTYGAEVASDMTGDHIGDMVVEDMSEGVVKEDERMDINEPTQAGAPASTCIGTWDSGEGGKPAEEETVTPAEKQLDNHAGTRAGTTTDMHVDSQVDKDTGAQTHTQRDLQKDTPADNPTDTHTDEKIDKETEGLTAEPIGAHTKEEKGTQKSGLADKDAQSHTDTQRIKPDDTHTNKATDSAHADGRNDKQPSPEAGKEIDTHSDTQMVKQDESLVNNSAETHTATQKDKQPDVLTDRDTDTHSGVAMESDEDEREQPQQTHTHTHDTNDRDTRGSRSRSSASASVDVDGAGEAGTRPMRMRDGMGGSTGNGRGKARALMGRPRGIKGAKRKRETVSGSVDGVEVEHGVGNMVGMGEDDSGNTSVGSGAHADMGLKARAKTRRKPGKGGAKRPHINKYATTGDLYADLVEIDQDEVNALFFPKYDPAAMVWNSTHTINQKNKYCYCGGKRTRKNCDLYCDQCNNWFHLDCVKINNSPTLAYGLHYKFVCKACVYTYDTRVALTAARDAKELQSGTKETSAPQAMDINSETQKEGPNDSTKGAEIGLNRTEAVDVIEKAVDGEVDRADAKTDTGDKISSGVRISSGVSISSEVNSSGEPSTGTGTGKKKANTVENVKGNEKSDTTATQTTDDVAMVNKDTPSQGATADNTADITESVQEIFFQESRQTWQPVVTQTLRARNPISADSAIFFVSKIEYLNLFLIPFLVFFCHRYIDAEPDPFRKGRDTFRPCLLSEEVVLSHQKRARQLKLSDDRLSVTGARGYCLAMATHCVRRGTYYYEVKLLPPEPVSDELPTSTSYMSGLTAASRWRPIALFLSI